MFLQSVHAQLTSEQLFCRLPVWLGHFHIRKSFLKQDSNLNRYGLRTATIVKQTIQVFNSQFNRISNSVFFMHFVIKLQNKVCHNIKHESARFEMLHWRPHKDKSSCSDY